jgi:hypothetical protein
MWVEKQTPRLKMTFKNSISGEPWLLLVPPVVDAADGDGHAEALQGCGLGPGQQAVHRLHLLHGERERAERPVQGRGGTFY